MLLRDEWLRSIHEKCLGPPSLTEDGEPFTKETDRVVAFDPYDSAEDQLESQYEKFENTEGEWSCAVADSEEHYEATLLLGLNQRQSGTIEAHDK